MAIPQQHTVTAKAKGLDMTQVYQETSGSVWAYVFTLVPHQQTAEDIVSNVYERACKNVRKYNPKKGSPTTWLLMMARTMVIDHWRQQQRRPQTSTEQLPEIADNQPDVDTRLDVRQWISSLSAQDRELIALKYYLDWDSNTIASFTDSSASTVRTKLQRILEQHPERKSL